MTFNKFVSIAFLVVPVLMTISFSIESLRSYESTSGELTEFSCETRRRGDSYEVELLTLQGERRNFDGVGFGCSMFSGLELKLGSAVKLTHKLERTLIYGLIVDEVVFIKPEESERLGLVGLLCIIFLLFWLSYYYWNSKRYCYESNKRSESK
jgi:hypothetical protein